jgi:hypothetical protein
MLAGQLLLVVLSLLSLGGVRWILTQPSRAVERPIPTSPLPAFVLDDGYFDVKGLT